MIYKKELNRIGALLVKQQQTLAVAESVTAGLLQNAFANVENASLFYQGGITAYNLLQKITQLSVDPLHAISCNCVSEKVAAEMALGVSRSFKTKWGIAITGYASPVPEQGLEDLFACYAFCFDRNIIKQSTIRAVKETAEAVEHFYLLAVLEDFMEVCTEAGMNTMIK